MQTGIFLKKKKKPNQNRIQVYTNNRQKLCLSELLTHEGNVFWQSNRTSMKVHLIPEDAGLPEDCRGVPVDFR